MERVFDPDIWRAVTGGEVAERVRRLTRVTPLVPAPALGRRTGADVWLKLKITSGKVSRLRRLE